MDKNTYETYEFLPENSDAENGQFFVVQDDGTFLLNRQIQYVAQVQDVKEVLEDVQPCTVFGVSAQQFFVDVDNSSELISVSDQFVLPEGENSLYTNSYLLQPSSSTATEQLEEDVVDQYNPQSIQDVNVDVISQDKQGNNFTEITLSDEQYQMLEQKGWILLESNDKIFVLNTLGLHDITTNEKLIQKLKNEILDDTNTDIDAGNFKIECESSELPTTIEKQFIEQEALEFVIGNNIEQNESTNVEFLIDNKENELTPLTTKEDMEICVDKYDALPESPVELQIMKQDEQNHNNLIKIKTKYNFKDIPEKIVLGKSINGKRLVAKVIKSKYKNSIELNPAKDRSLSSCAATNTPQPQPSASSQSQLFEKLPDNKPYFAEIDDNQQYNVTGLHETEFIKLIQSTLRGGLKTKFNEEDLASANTVMSQLLKVSNIKQTLIGYNIIVTKASNSKDEFGTIHERRKLSLVTGHVTERDDVCSFEHLPNLLQSIKHNSDQNVSHDQPFNSIEEKDVKEMFTVYHVHVAETKSVDNIKRVSVTLNKRQLPMNLVFDLKRRYPNPVFACSACASLFKSEETLKEHQQSNNCMITTDDSLTNDTEKLNDNEEDYMIQNIGKETLFSCAQCDIKFTNIHKIQEHIKSIHRQEQQLTDIEKGFTKLKDENKFKCKMCPSSYYYAASLSKHIVTRHIKVKSN